MKYLIEQIPILCFAVILVVEIVYKASTDVIAGTLVCSLFISYFG